MNGLSFLLSILSIDFFDTTVLPSLLHPSIQSSSPYISSLQSLSSSLPLTIIGCIDSQPSSLSLALLSSLSSSSSSSSQPSSPSHHTPTRTIPTLAVENDIPINLISSSSDSYVQSDESSSDEIPTTVYESNTYYYISFINSTKEGSETPSSTFTYL